MLKPSSVSASGYRQYGDDSTVRLQQIMFFRELGFALDEIKLIGSRPDFDVIEALQSHRTLLKKRAERIDELSATLDKTINKLKGKATMQIKEYYECLSDEKIEQYRKEVRERWGDKMLEESEARVIKMGKPKMATLQAEGGAIFKAIADNMAKGPDSKEVQALVAKWRQWLENFAHYSDEAVLGLGQFYSQHPDFAKFFGKYHKDLAPFLTKAIEHYCATKK